MMFTTTHFGLAHREALRGTRRRASKRGLPALPALRRIRNPAAALEPACC